MDKKTAEKKNNGEKSNEEKNDSREKNRKRREKRIVSLLFIFMGVLVGIKGGQIIDHALPEDAPGYMLIGSLTLLLLAFYVSLLLHTFIHETGHMLFGLASGYQFVSIRFFSLMFVKQGGKLQVKKMSIEGTGGQCLMLPPSCDGSSLTRLYHWGGCILNLIFSLISFLCMILFGENPFLDGFFFSFGICGIGTAMLNGIPFQSLGNDGYNAMTLSHRKNARIAVEKTLMVNQAMADHVRLKNMPFSWFLLDQENEDILWKALNGKSTPQEFSAALELLSDHLVVSFVILKMNYEMDLHHFEQAEKIGKFILEHTELIDLHKMSVTADLLYLELIGKRRTEVIEKLLDKETEKKMKMLSSLPSMYRVWYAYNKLYKKDEKKAQEALGQFKKLAEKGKYPYQGDLELEWELIGIVDEY